jgi:hypothetical protein
MTVAKPKKVKSGWSNLRLNRQVSQNFLGSLLLKKGCCASDDDDDNGVFYHKDPLKSCTEKRAVESLTESFAPKSVHQNTMP